MKARNGVREREPAEVNKEGLGDWIGSLELDSFLGVKLLLLLEEGLLNAIHHHLLLFVQELHHLLQVRHLNSVTLEDYIKLF